MVRPSLILATILLPLSILLAQNTEGSLIGFDYEKTPIGSVIVDLENRYRVAFAYSSDLLPLEYPLTAKTAPRPVSEAMRILFERAPVDYMVIQGQVVLRHNPAKVVPPPPPPKREISRKAPEPQPTTPFYRRIVPEPTQVIAAQGPPAELPDGYRVGPDRFNLDPLLSEFEADLPDRIPAKAPQRRLGQVSLVPRFGTNAFNKHQTINHLSLNVIGGVNGGVEGLEIGGIFNGIKGDVFGVQIAGAVNHTEGSLVGVQAAGLVNVTKRSSYAFQAAGLANWSLNELKGTQIAGLLNRSGGTQQRPPFQIGGLGNINTGYVTSQIGGVFNKADTVADLQLAGFINIAKVAKQQVGLINVADSVSGTPLGLINLIRKGYNRIELAGEETLFANVSLKLGNRKFYNIFRLGARWSTQTDSTLVNGSDPTQRTINWALGYGIGSAPRLNDHLALTSELTALQVNEGGGWTEQLNLLSQLRVSLDVDAGATVSFFAGPVINVHFSKWQDPETGTFLSELAPYTFWELEQDGLRAQAWVGFTAGIRVNPL